MLIHSLTLIAGLIVLFFSASKFVTGAASIARNLALSPLLIGLTVVGFGTSVPEILMAAFASFDGNPGLAVGDAIGANIANIGLVLGSAALIKPVSCQSSLLKQQLIILLALSLLCYFVSFDGLGVGDSCLLLLLLVIFLIWLVLCAKKQEFVGAFEKELKSELPDTVSAKQAWIYVAAGAIGLLISAKLSVWAAVNVAHLAGLSDLIIGLTVLAIGTSLPELATAISSVRKKQDDLAVGSIVSSSIYNLLVVYALPGLIAPGAVADGVLSRDFPVMLGFTLVVLLLSVGIVNKAGSINRWAAAFLLSAYAGYLWFIYQSITGL
jgi:cation:H+ antiporter